MKLAILITRKIDNWGVKLCHFEIFKMFFQILRSLMGHFYTYINIFWSLKVKTQSMKFLKVVCVRLGKKIWNSISNRCYFLVNYFIGFKITTYDFSRMMWIFSQFSGKGSKYYLYSIIYLVHYIPCNDIIHTDLKVSQAEWHKECNSRGGSSLGKYCLFSTYILREPRQNIAYVEIWRIFSLIK